ncbi:hypothetical protein, partial [Sulfuracidifex metallicus]|uniref:hypothetical protein n=1 Tax=Sulfuracidifex metallicus TaxID=47303 RepID=UPI000AD8F255
GILLSPGIPRLQLFPPYKRDLQNSIELVMGFILAGPFSAAIFAVLSIMAGQWGLAGNLGLEVASPFLLQVIPDLLGFGAAKGLMGGFGITAPKVKQSSNGGQGNTNNGGQGNAKVITVPANIGRGGSQSSATQQNNKVVTVPASTNKSVEGHTVEVNQPTGSMGIIGRVR